MVPPGAVIVKWYDVFPAVWGVLVEKWQKFRTKK